jgi:dihydroxyacid dehydratase/phosphogluconate dehydratase
VINMAPPDYLLQRGVEMLPCLGDGRQSGTSGSPSILHVAPEAAVGGDLAVVQTDDIIAIDVDHGRVDLCIDDAEFARRRASLRAPVLVDQTPWQTLYRRFTTQLDEGASLDLGQTYRRIDQTCGVPRHNH